MMTQKDELELAWWRSADIGEQIRKYSLYLWAWGFFSKPRRVLEIGPGPIGGFLPVFVDAEIRVGIEPLADQYELEYDLNLPGMTIVPEYFERWLEPRRNGCYTYDAIFSADSLDHGDMGFHLIPGIADLLAPGGRFYLHVHLRPAELLNLIHDHSLTIAQLDEALAETNLVELRRDVYEKDLDGWECPTLVGVWERPR